MKSHQSQSQTKEAASDPIAVLFESDLFQKIRNIAAELGVSESDALKLSITLAEVAVRETRKGEKLAFIDANDKVKAIVTGLG